MHCIDGMGNLFGSQPSTSLWYHKCWSLNVFFCRQRGQSLGLSLAKMKTLLHVCCILELCSMVVVQNIPTFKGRGIRTTNSTRSQQIDIQNMIEAKKRKDYIKRQILHILNFSSISNHPPEQPSSVRTPQKAKKYTPDHSILSEPAGKFHLAKCLFFSDFPHFIIILVKVTLYPPSP